jgi:hypothetical protein
MLISSLFFTLKENKKSGFFLGDYKPSEDLSAILEEKSGKTTNGLTPSKINAFNKLCRLKVNILRAQKAKFVDTFNNTFNTFLSLNFRCSHEADPGVV